MTLRYLSLCSGIEAASVAWMPLGWEPVAFAEIEPFPSAVLARHYPGVPNLGDMTRIDGRQYRGAVDILVAGTPCQAFSVAGARRGLDDRRGNLTLKFVEIANEINPAFIVWENVPGVLSMHDNAFGCFLGGLAGCDFQAEPGPLPPVGKSSKYWRWDRRGERHIPTWPVAGVTVGPERAIAWRTLDAQYFGLAQRRRRVFVVACPRSGGRHPEQILFEWEGVRRDSPPSRQAPQDIAGTLEASLGRSRGAGTDPGACVAAGHVFPCSQYGTVAASLTSEGADASPCADRGPTVLAVRTAQTSTNGNGIVQDVSHTLDRANGQAVMAFHGAETGVCYAPEIVSQALSSKWAKGTSGPAGDEHHNLICVPSLQVRRLTPRECERLQGFPDDYTAIEYRGRPAADGPRYRAIGNSMAVNVMRWIGERIDQARTRLSPKEKPGERDRA